ncbi:unnamed protein product [Dicrocoelium dendriticum]|nr:unnamed protein product [Dicrocoelium dendriticum]
MELSVVGAVLFSFINICIGIFCLTDAITADQLRLILKRIGTDGRLYSLLGVHYSGLCVIVGETVGITSCLCLLAFIVYKMPQRVKEEHVDVLCDQTNATEETLCLERLMAESNLHSFMKQLQVERITNSISSYHQKLRRELQRFQRDASIFETVWTRKRDAGLPDEKRMETFLLSPVQSFDAFYRTQAEESEVDVYVGIEQATCEWVSEDAQEKHHGSSRDGKITTSCLGDHHANEATEIHLNLTVDCRRQTASYKRSVHLVVMFSCILLVVCVPYHFHLITLHVLRRAVPFTLLRLERLIPTGEGGRGTEVDGFRKAFYETFKCQSMFNETGCSISVIVNEFGAPTLVRECHGKPETIQLTEMDASSSTQDCYQQITRWIGMRQASGGFRIALALLMYTVSISLNIRRLALLSSQASVQTYPRQEWWRGVGERHELPSNIGVQCDIEERTETRNRARGRLAELYSWNSRSRLLDRGPKNIRRGSRLWHTGD